MNPKLFRGAILETILLNLINESHEQGMHGYAIFVAVKKRFGVSLGPSTLYPELKRLEHKGLVKGAWNFGAGKARRSYKITPRGKIQLREYSAELKVVVPAFVTCKT